MLHGCTIGDNCLIGIGATVLNNTSIGENCLIGAHTLLPEGKTIPAGSLVMGSPGRIVRSLTPGEIEGLRATARHYVDNMHRFQAHFAPYKLRHYSPRFVLPKAIKLPSPIKNAQTLLFLSTLLHRRFRKRIMIPKAEKAAKRATVAQSSVDWAITRPGGNDDSRLDFERQGS